MSIIRFMDPPFFRQSWPDLERLRQDMDRMVKRTAAHQAGSQVFPPLNIYEDSDAVFVTAEVAGVVTENIDISVEGETLTISGERKSLPREEKSSYHRREIETGKFSRAVALPTKINLEGVSARLQDGILAISLPKAEEVKPKKIAVNVK
ncbi:MAG: Hsp20/alpha crystallin family protein [Thermodesulfobacteriota bacterium]|nr:Hsp20/alpha crystallin family protein [Thermodesulfobacteriota bacterium]